MSLCLPKPNPRGRCTQFGLEVPETVTWRNWEPGKEYTKSIPIKNIKIKTQRIQYKVPTLQVFSSHYPKPVSLSSGTSHVISVSFKPVERGVYSDKIVVQTEEGEVEIPIRATLPQPKIELVESVQFGMVALTDTNSLFFKIRNSSDVGVNFRFELPSPFTISPTHGTLRPKQDCQLHCTFTPPQACVYAASAVCRYKGNSQTVELMGTGKFAYIQVETASGQKASVLDFKRVSMGQSLTKTILLSNKSPVTAPFRINPLWVQKGPLSPYTCSESSGRIAAFDKQKLKITFTPNNPGGPFIEYVSIECVGSLTSTTLQCVGEAASPQVSLSMSCVEFSSVACGSVSRRVLEIHNTSPVDTVFQFMNVSGTVFSVQPCVGKMRANSKLSLTVTFSPSDPIPYYRRIVALIHYQQPLSLDLVGSGTTDAVNPVLLRQTHLQMYRQRHLKGLAPYPPDQLKIWQADDLISLTTDSVHISPHATFVHKLVQPEITEDPCQSIFDSDPRSQLVLDTRELEFGYGTDTHSQTVSATNLSKGVISCAWSVPRESQESFSVTPRVCEVPPGASFEFKVFFSPTQSNKFHNASLECYGYFKSQKDYHLVEDVFVSPSWCSLLQVSGHTWKRGLENSPSALSWDSREILFHPQLPGSTAYKTLTLSNRMDVPIQFNFRAPDNPAVDVAPRLGLLSEEQQVFILKLSGVTTPALFSTSLLCDINHDTKHPEKLVVCGTVETPKLSFPDGNYLYFHPCVQEGRVTKQVRVRNTSLLPVKFQWSTQGAEPGITQIVPAQGEILPNEIQSHSWSFSPHTEGRHSFRGVISTSFIDPSYSHEDRLSISLVGDCCKGELYVTDRSIDLGHVTVRSNHKETVTLINACPCDLTYQLSYSAIYTQEGAGESGVCGVNEVQLSPTEGTLTGGSRQFVNVHLRPEHQGRYRIEILYQVVTEKKYNPATRPLLSLTTEVCYPSLSIQDVTLVSGTGHISKPRLWEMLNLDPLNTLLSQEPSYDEMRYDIATRHSMKRRIPVLTRAILDFNFCSAPLNSPDSEVLLLLENPTPVPVSYAFQFPNDMYLEPEYWADTGELDQFEARELYLMENSIFSVDSKSGSLLPGARRQVKCSHRHKLAGESTLPVLLKIRKGREVLLNFKGTTSPLSSPHVDILSDTFHFRPIPVGLLLPPLQSYKLYNGGDTGCTYSLDTGPLSDMVQQTNGLQVLECLNPTGSIPPFGTTELLFLFTPPQPVLYTVDLELSYNNADSKLISFIAQGFTLNTDSTDNSMLPDRQEVVRVPVKQLIQSQTEMAILSSNTIRFQHLPLFSPARRIAFLSNHSKRTLSFEWKMPSERVSEVLTIKPQKGYLHPHQCILCQVLFLSTVDPAFYDVTLSCVIVDESSLVAYKQELREWERKQTEKQHMFTISSDNSDEMMASRVVKRHNTLPPLEQESYEEWASKDLSRRSKHRPRRNKETDAPKPIPPSPFSLELCVSARTHSIADYCTLFPHTHMPYIDTHEIISAMQPVVQSDTISHTHATSHLLTSLLSSLLHDLIHDPSFISCLSSISEEPTPYFVQFQKQPPSPSRLELSFDENLDTDLPHTESAASGLSKVEAAEKVVRPTSEQMDRLKKLESVNVLLEGVLENSIRSILNEAAVQEIDITAKPHIIAMLPNDP